MTLRDPLRLPLTRRRLVQVVGATAGAASLAGPIATTRSVWAAAAQEAASGELRVAAPQDNYRIDPPERANVGMYGLNTNIFESLVRLMPDYRIEPLLAESWEFVEPNTYRFRLR